MTIGLAGMNTVESAVRRLDELTSSPNLSEEGRATIAWALSDLVPVICMDPGPTSEAFTDETFDVSAAGEAMRAALGTLVTDLCDPIAHGLSPMDVVTISAAIGDAAALLPELVTTS
jgi:hypothetical protein